jgi:hypothetical protein
MTFWLKNICVKNYEFYEGLGYYDFLNKEISYGKKKDDINIVLIYFLKHSQFQN